MTPRITRRTALQGIAATASLATLNGLSFAEIAKYEAPLEEFHYDQIAVLGERQLEQRENVLSVLNSFNDDSLLYPFRAMSGKPASGTSLHGWYAFLPNYDSHHDTEGLAPGATFGQWVSAFARFYQQSQFEGAGDANLAERATRLNGLLSESIGSGYFEKTLFPAYSYDKLVVGLMDGHRLTADKTAFATLDRITDLATPSLPGRAIPRDTQWKLGKGVEYMWDESYTLPENLYLVSKLGAGDRYSTMGPAISRRRHLLRAARAQHQRARRPPCLQLRQRALLRHAGIPDGRQ